MVVHVGARRRCSGPMSEHGPAGGAELRRVERGWIRPVDAVTSLRSEPRLPRRRVRGRVIHRPRRGSFAPGGGRSPKSHDHDRRTAAAMACRRVNAVTQPVRRVGAALVVLRQRRCGHAPVAGAESGPARRTPGAVRAWQARDTSWPCSGGMRPERPCPAGTRHVLSLRGRRPTRVIARGARTRGVPHLVLRAAPR